MSPTLLEHVVTSRQWKGVALIGHQQQPDTAAAGRTTHQLPAAMFLTKTHFDIFGLFFPVALPDLPSAVTLVADLYHHVNVTLSLRPSIKTVTKSRGADTAWPQVWQQELETLTRQVTVSTAIALKHRIRCRMTRHRAIPYRARWILIWHNL